MGEKISKSQEKRNKGLHYKLWTIGGKKIRWTTSGMVIEGFGACTRFTKAERRRLYLKMSGEYRD